MVRVEVRMSLELLVSVSRVGDVMVVAGTLAVDLRFGEGYLRSHPVAGLALGYAMKYTCPLESISLMQWV